MGSVYVGMPWGELSGLCVRFGSFIDIGVVGLFGPSWVYAC